MGLFTLRPIINITIKCLHFKLYTVFWSLIYPISFFLFVLYLNNDRFSTILITIKRQGCKFLYVQIISGYYSVGYHSHIDNC